MSNLLLMPGSWDQVPYLREAVHRQMKTVVLDRDPKAMLMQRADQSWCIDPRDLQGVLNFTRGKRFAAVLPGGNDLALPAAAAVAEACALPSPTRAQVSLCTRKDLFRGWIEQTLPEYCPLYACLSEPGELKRSIRKVGLPAIMKPADNCGSRGVRIVTTDDEAVEAFEEAKTISKCGQVVVEELLAGREISLDGFVIDDDLLTVALVERFIGPPPYRVIVEHVAPAALRPGDAARIIAATQSVSHALSLRNCPVHAEWIVTDEGPKLLEMGLRLAGGGLAAELIPLVTQVDMISLAFDLALGLPCKVNPKPSRGAAICFLTADSRFAEDKAPVDSTVDIRFWKQPARSAATPKDCSARIGRILTQGRDAAEARGRAHEVLRELACANLSRAMPEDVF